MSILSTKTDKIFFVKNCKYSNPNKVDLILAPDFYWVRIFDIPIKNSTQAKNLLPTLFEDLLKDNTVYTYKAIKISDGKFLSFAYNNKEILEAIKDSGLNTNLINNVYFAQTELNEFKNFNYGNKSYVYTAEDILVELPSSLKQDFTDVSNEINNITLSSNKIDIKFYNNVISTKQILSLSILLLFFILLNIINIFNYNSKISDIDNKKSEFISKNSLPTSQLQLNSIVNSYKQSLGIETKKREIYKFLSQNKDLNIQNFSIKDKIIEFRVTNKKQLTKLQNFAKKYNSKISPSTEFINVRIEL